MPLRPPAGYIYPGYNPLKVPNAPTIGTVTAGNTQADVTFTAPSDVGGAAITQYTAVSTPGGLYAQGSASPLTVTGLTNGTAYTFAVWALNTYGPSPYSAASGSVTPSAPQRVLTAGDANNYATYGNVISYVEIMTTGNATDFGDLTVKRGGLGACASTTRGVFCAGYSDAGGGTNYNTIDYVTIASTGNAAAFGDYSLQTYGVSGCNDATRGVFAGNNGTNTNSMYYITIASTGNSTSFGQLTGGTTSWPASFSSSTRGVFAGGLGTGGSGGRVNVIQYITIANTGNATDFGDLSNYVGYAAGASNSTRGIIFGGNNSSSVAINVIEYVTIASTGNATDFGDLLAATFQLGAAAGDTRAVACGGRTSVAINTIQYVTIASTGNATSFGNLTAAVYWDSSLCSYNGGVQ